jgi:hypothetical protein
MPKKKNKFVQAIVKMPSKITVFIDPRTKCNYFALPVSHPTTRQKFQLSLIRLNPFLWSPTTEIEEITIKFRENEDSPIK